MRTSGSIRILALMLAAAAGCTQRDPTIAEPPSHAELPQIIPTERTLPVRVDIAHRGREPTVRLVPDFTEPELTAEEKEALGQREPWIVLLPYKPPYRQYGSTAGPDYAGVQTLNRGRGGVLTDLGNLTTPLAGVYGRGGVLTDSDTFGVSVSGRYLARPPVARVGHREGIVVDTGRAKLIAERRRTAGQ